MLKDITLGQYFPGNSPIHKMDARVKIVLAFGYIVMLFMAKTIWGLAAASLFVLLSFAVSKIAPIMMVKSLKPILPLIIITSILNLFFIDTGKVLWHWKFFKITQTGVETCVFMAIRIVALIVGTSLLTYTTSPIELTDAIERLLSPLKKIKVPVHELAMMMTIALRFIPTLIEETEKITNAQKSRGADLESGNLIQRAKALVPILIPLFISAFRRAEDLALAMECRCYCGGEGRTRLKQSKVVRVYFAGIFVTLVFAAGIIVINRITA